MRSFALACGVIAGVALYTGVSTAAPEPSPDITMEQVVKETMKPYTGPSHKGGDTNTLRGKVMCGYQGWFACPGDGCGRGWVHWGPGQFRPGKASVDLWPDVSELSADERFDTGFKNQDGSTAQVFSAFTRETVLRHFKWMRDYGIDGAFIQRFEVEVRHPVNRRQFTTMLSHCREGANLYGRAYAVMYDMDFGVDSIRTVKQDWMDLIDHMRLTKDHSYLKENGHPVIALWGYGFTHRKWDTKAVSDLLDFLKNDPKYGKCTVMLGVPTNWRTLSGDCRPDKEIIDLMKKADIISPWTVGRFGTPEEASKFTERYWPEDKRWCDANGKFYLPVVFPGFTWHNLIPDSKPNAIPRLKGRFLWSQYYEVKRHGFGAVYQAMFDEVDEGTAIFKCVSNPPDGFVGYENVPSDHYLWLVGQAGRMIRGERPVTATMPVREEK